MQVLTRYKQFCNLFHNYKIPEIKIKDLNPSYLEFYKREYGLIENDVNKASFVIFLLTFSTTFLLSCVFTSINLIMIIFYSLMLSIICLYRFNLYLYNKVSQIENKIDSLLFLIKINFNLVKRSLKNNADYCLYFIDLMKNLDSPLSNEFRKILEKVHLGARPEAELFNFKTPSRDFNNFMRELIGNKFNYKIENNEFSENTIDEKINLYIKEIESKISLVFFIGFFYPISIAFLIIFMNINTIFTITLVILFLFLLKYLFNHFIRFKIPIIGFFINRSSSNKKLYEEFLNFFGIFAFKLKSNISPEKAFLETYSENKTTFTTLKQIIEPSLQSLICRNFSFIEVLNEINFTLKSNHYTFIIYIIKNMIHENSYYSSYRILEILNVLKDQKKLSRKIELTFQGESFKVFLFLFLLPIIVGVISGLLPFFSLLNSNFNLMLNTSQNYIWNPINIYNIIIIASSLCASNIITSYYFLKIVNYQKKIFLLIIPNLFFIITFLGSFTFFMGLIA